MFKGKLKSELTLKVTIDRENSEFSQVPKTGGSHCIPSGFNINQALKQLVILATSLSLREHGSM